MTTTKLTVKLGRTYNTGNYESLRIDAGMESDLELSQTIEVLNAYEDLFSQCEKAVRKERDKLLDRIANSDR